MNNLLYKVSSRAFPKLMLPGALRLKQHLTTQEVLASYLEFPEYYWRGVSRRHLDKINKAKSELRKLGYSETSQLVDALVNAVKIAKEDNLDQPIFIMGAGGSGTTWLGAMLGGLAGYCYGREIYVPPALSNLYRRYQTDEIKDVIWAIMLLHAWGLHDPATEFRSNFVNSGRSIFDYDIFKKIWPNAHFIFLVRDPRDQILSVTHRKEDYRNALAPGANDKKYLQRNAKQLKKIYRHYLNYENERIMVVKYEELSSKTFKTLKSIVDNFDLSCSIEELKKVEFRHNANNMRNGNTDIKGNLDEGGKSQPWAESMSHEERNIIFPIIQQILLAFNYESDDEWKHNIK